MTLRVAPPPGQPSVVEVQRDARKVYLQLLRLRADVEALMGGGVAVGDYVPDRLEKAEYAINHLIHNLVGHRLAEEGREAGLRVVPEDQ